MADINDTICALSSPPGRSGIAIVRMSGMKCLEIYKKVFHTKSKRERPIQRVSNLGRLVDPRNGDEIDQAIAVFFPSPHSYTGEDMTEYCLHGSPVLISWLLDCFCFLGARLAEPGEFTKRAFLNGKMDLTQVEAVGDIIDASTLYQARIAARQRSGDISTSIQPIKTALTDIIVQMESSLEFVEEALELQSKHDIQKRIEEIRDLIHQWIETYRKGRIVRDGFNMAVIGRPNVGKSSIFNALLKQDRSIVMDFPGTTRDLISEYTNIGGIPVRLLDTAGIQCSQDSVEILGMERTYQAIGEADAILLVTDTSRPLTAEDEELRSRQMPVNCVMVLNKCDLASCWTEDEKMRFTENFKYIEVSAKTGVGIEKLRNIVFDSMFGDNEFRQDGILITSLRQCHCLETAAQALAEASGALNVDLSEEFVLVHLYRGLKEIGAVCGEISTEDILSQIFSRFCIGK